MFNKFTRKKLKYNKGQIFPFLLAILCVMIILIMITVNLGQIGIWRTDVSNAADAGALAGASVLSGTLLNLGLKSDQLCGYGVAILVAFILFLVFKQYPAAISLIMSSSSKAGTEALMIGDVGMIGWANAKKTAMNYALQNIGVDEPRQSFAGFMKNVYGITDLNSLSISQRDDYYQVYLRGDRIVGDSITSDDGDATDVGVIDIRKKIRNNTQNGFSLFLQKMDGAGGWYEKKIGKFVPLDPALYREDIDAGYGWKQDAQGILTDTFTKYITNGSRVDKLDTGLVAVSPTLGMPPVYEYDNYVTVQVNGATGYKNLKISGLKDWLTQDPPFGLGQSAGEYVFAELAIGVGVLSFMTNPISSIPIVGWIIAAILAIIAAVLFYVGEGLPMGLIMENEKEQTDGNYITVKVTRWKRPMNYGLWEFQYGAGEISSTAISHAYREGATDDEKNKISIRPTAVKKFEEIFSNPLNILNWGGLSDGWFDSSRHLFETELARK